MDRVHLIRANDDVTKLLMQEATDFEMDTIQVYNEKKLECKLNDYNFGLKGIIDKYIIDDEAKTITIIDLKTTGDINKFKKHQKPGNNEPGGIVEKEMPIQVSNLSFYDSASKKGVKLGYKFNNKNEKIRIIRSTGKEVK